MKAYIFFFASGYLAISLLIIFNPALLVMKGINYVDVILGYFWPLEFIFSLVVSLYFGSLYLLIRCYRLIES